MMEMRIPLFDEIPASQVIYVTANATNLSSEVFLLKKSDQNPYHAEADAVMTNNEEKSYYHYA